MKKLLFLVLWLTTLTACAQNKSRKIILPTYPGDIQTYLANNIKYPDSARNRDIEGRVIVRFMVTKTGEVTKVKIVKGIGGGCDEEVLRVINMMGKWTPGTRKGKPIEVYYILPVNFTLEEENSEESLKTGRTNK
jgi:TonB family protein